MGEMKLEGRAMPTVCFAPPLSDEKLTEYKTAIAEATGPVNDAGTKLLACVEVWWNLPDSKRNDGSRLKLFHRSGQGTDRAEKVIELVPLEKEHQKSLYDLIPWDYELDAMEALFNTIPNDSQKKLRDTVFHLLWFVRELNLDREPVTADKL